LLVSLTSSSKTLVVTGETDIFDNPISFLIEKDKVKETLGGLEDIEEEKELLKLKKEFSERFNLPFDGRYIYLSIGDKSPEEAIKELLPICTLIVDTWKLKEENRIKEYQELKLRKQLNPFSVLKLAEARNIANLLELNFPIPAKNFAGKSLIETERFFLAAAGAFLQELIGFIRKLTRNLDEIELLISSAEKITAVALAMYVDGKNNRKICYSIYLFKWKPSLKKVIKKSTLKNDFYYLLEGKTDRKTLTKLVKGVLIELI